MPAAAVIPAPIAYIKVVAVEKLVVEGGVFDEFSAGPCLPWVVDLSAAHGWWGTAEGNPSELGPDLNSAAWH